jgi:Ca-activated chloride channel family protein
MNFSHAHFAEPSWLWLAFLGPLLLLGLQWYSAVARKRQLARLAAAHSLEQLTRSHSPLRRLIKNILLILVVAGTGLALARPQWGQQELAGQALGDDIIFILDCSRSMLAADISPTRLQRAKLSILDFMHRRTHNRLGLVAFAGQAFLQCPLTFDYSAFEDALLAIDEKTIPIPGTDIAGGLDEGFRALEKGEHHKILVLLTDGEDLEKGGVQKAEALAKQGVVVFTLGIGTPAGAEIQLINEQGRPELLRDQKGSIVRSRLDETTLRNIAQATKGSYFPLGALGEGLVRVGIALEGLTSGMDNTPARKLGVDRFYFPVSIVLILLVVESLIGTRRRFKDIHT